MVYNPQRNFLWTLEIDGAPIGGGFNDLLQDVTLPVAEFTTTVHGAAGNTPDIETPNKAKFSELIFKKLNRIDTPDNIAWTKFAAALSGIPGLYLFNGFLNEKDQTGKTISRYVIQNAWVKKIEKSNMVASNADADNSFETVTCFVQAFYPAPIQAFKTAFG
jgi:hypothetical protein